jgi:hypothetical protein
MIPLYITCSRSFYQFAETIYKKNTKQFVKGGKKGKKKTQKGCDFRLSHHPVEDKYLKGSWFKE